METKVRTWRPLTEARNCAAPYCTDYAASERVFQPAPYVDRYGNPGMTNEVAVPYCDRHRRRFFSDEPDAQA